MEKNSEKTERQIFAEEILDYYDGNDNLNDWDIINDIIRMCIENASESYLEENERYQNY